MNELIKQLAHRAWVDNDQLDACGYTDLQKFAELIVRECSNWLKQPVNQTPSCCVSMNIAADRLKEHFGVE